MIFKSKEKLFHDIPNQGDSVSSKRYSRTTKNFARWYYEEGLNDGAERAAAGLGLLWECKFRHWDQHKREKRKTIQSLGRLFLLALCPAGARWHGRQLSGGRADGPSRGGERDRVPQRY